MRIQGLVVGVLVTGGVVFAMRGCFRSPAAQAPDERLAQRLGSMCEIARNNIKTPEQGLRTLGSYLDKNVDKVMSDYGAMFAAIERIPDDAKHDDRARLARDRLRKPLVGCDRDWQQFADAVNKDPAAAALLEHFAQRLSRTLEIISGQHQEPEMERPGFTPGLGIDFAHLPQQLETLF